MSDFVIADPKQKVADLTGLTPEQIGASHLQVDILKREGMLVNLDISGTSMFVCGADWGELGVADDSTSAQRMTPGRKYLYPKAQVNRLNSVVSAMRQALERLTYDLTGFRPARYMHYKVYSNWKTDWEALLARFVEIKNDLIAMHDQAVDELAEDFRQIALEAWRSHLGAGGQWLVFGGVAYDDLDHFTDAVMAKALSKMPSVDQIEAGLTADYRVSMLYGLDDIAKQEAAAQVAREKAQAELERIQAEKQAAYLAEATEQERYNHEQRMIRLAEQEKEIQIEAMLQAEAAHAREQLRQIASPFAEVMNGLRDQFAKDAEEMLKSIQKNGFCRGKVAERGKGLLEIYELMSISDDLELRARLEQLKHAIGAVGDERGKNTPERSTEQVAAALESIKELAHQAAVDLSAGPSRFSFIE